MNKSEENTWHEMFAKFLDEFQKESDRGAAMLAASMLDQKLKTILENYLINCKSTKSLLEDAYSPISTFNARIQLAFSLGLIPEYEFNECEIIRKIRNVFAHEFQLEFSFNNDKVARQCRNLKSPLPGGRSNYFNKPRSLFETSIAVLNVSLLYREDQVRKIRLTRPDWKKYLNPDTDKIQFSRPDNDNEE